MTLFDLVGAMEALHSEAFWLYFLHVKYFLAKDGRGEDEKETC